MSYSRFTDEQIAQMRQCHAEGMTLAQTAARIGRLANSILVKGRQLGLAFPKAPTRVPVSVSHPVKHIIPRYVRHSDLTGRLMGDPPPGRSALDQKRASQ